MNATSLVHGLIAGCTAAYLKDPTTKQTNKSVDAAPLKNSSIMQLTLQVNHLLLLTAETIHFAGSPLGAFRTVVQVACACTPAAAMVADYSTNKEFISEERLGQISMLYQAGVVATSLATLALGNPVFAVASLSVLALDAVASGNAEYLLSIAKKVGACLALIGYGAQSFAAEGLAAGLATINAGLIWLDSLSKMEFAHSPYRPYYASTDRDSDDTHRYISDNGYSASPFTSDVSSFASQIGNSLCRPGAFA